MAKLRVLVACGTSIATATHVANSVKETAKAAGIDVDVAQCKAAEIKGKIQKVAEETFTEVFSQKGGAQIVTEPGPDVLRFSSAIVATTDVSRVGGSTRWAEPE